MVASQQGTMVEHESTMCHSCPAQPRDEPWQDPPMLRRRREHYGPSGCTVLGLGWSVAGGPRRAATGGRTTLGQLLRRLGSSGGDVQAACRSLPPGRRWHWWRGGREEAAARMAGGRRHWRCAGQVEEAGLSVAGACGGEPVRCERRGRVGGGSRTVGLRQQWARPIGYADRHGWVAAGATGQSGSGVDGILRRRKERRKIIKICGTHCQL